MLGEQVQVHWLIWEKLGREGPRGVPKERDEAGVDRQRAVPQLFSHNIPNPAPTKTSCYDPPWSWLVIESACASARRAGGEREKGAEGEGGRGREKMNAFQFTNCKGKGWEHKKNQGQATIPSEEPRNSLDNRRLAG